MRRIVVSLLKGGVAKSETSVHLAHGLALAGYRVLLVDTDVQSHCAEMLGLQPERGLADLIAGWVDPLHALAKARPNLWLLAGGNDLAAVKMEIARREMAPEAVLAEALACYEGRFHFMVMDTAPGWDTLLVNALYCSEEVLAPVSMEPMAISGLKRFEERLEVIRRYKPRLTLRWVLPTFVDGRVKKSQEILRQLRERYGERLADPVRYSVKLSETTAYGQTVFEHDPKGAGAQAYRQLVQRVAESPRLWDDTPAPVSWDLTQEERSQQAGTRQAVKVAPAPAPVVEETPPPKPVAEPRVVPVVEHIAVRVEAEPAPPRQAPVNVEAEVASDAALAPATPEEAGEVAVDEQEAARVHRRQPLNQWLQRVQEHGGTAASDGLSALASEEPVPPEAVTGNPLQTWGRRLSKHLGLRERVERVQNSEGLAGHAGVAASREGLVRDGRT